MTAVYARQSIDRPDSVSIESQIEQCSAIASGSIKVYKDQGYSGKNTNRPEFEQMLADIKKGRIKTVISYRLDRISRNIIDFANLLNMFDKYGVQYISATEQFDTSTPMGRAMIYIVMVFAQLERETIATRIADNYRYRSSFGLFMGGNTPFGYSSRRGVRNGKKVSVLTPNGQADTLRYIFDSYEAGNSLMSICHRLNEKNIKTAKNHSWVNNSLKRVLKNIAPCRADKMIYEYLVSAGYNVSNSIDDFDGEHGMCIFFKNKNRNQQTEISDQVAVVGLHKPIIPSMQYINVQNMLNADMPKRGKRSQRSCLAGLVKCKECGYSFGLKYTRKNGREYKYYRCRGRESRGVCTNSVYISADALEKGIVKRCKQYLNHFSFESIKSTSNDISETSAEIKNLNGQIQNLIDNIGKGNTVVDELLTRKITQIKNRIDSITAKTALPPAEKDMSADAFIKIKDKFSKFESLDMIKQTDAIRSIIKTVLIDKNGIIDIRFLF